MTKNDAFHRTFSLPIIRRSLVVALLVGITLNLINQGDTILSGGTVIGWKMALTFCVPFLVASYGSYSALRAAPSETHRSDHQC